MVILCACVFVYAYVFLCVNAYVCVCVTVCVSLCVCVSSDKAHRCLMTGVDEALRPGHSFESIKQPLNGCVLHTQPGGRLQPRPLRD